MQERAGLRLWLDYPTEPMCALCEWVVRMSANFGPWWFTILGGSGVYRRPADLGESLIDGPIPYLDRFEDRDVEVKNPYVVLFYNPRDIPAVYG